MFDYITLPLLIYLDKTTFNLVNSVTVKLARLEVRIWNRQLMVTSWHKQMNILAEVDIDIDVK